MANNHRSIGQSICYLETTFVAILRIYPSLLIYQFKGHYVSDLVFSFRKQQRRKGLYFQMLLYVSVEIENDLFETSLVEFEEHFTKTHIISTKLTNSLDSLKAFRAIFIFSCQDFFHKKKEILEKICKLLLAISLCQLDET
jgi:hypothetical protein